MWTAVGMGMKDWLPSITLALAAQAAADLCPGSAGGPTLVTPGSATCVSESTATGTRTIFSVMDDTILDWGWLNLPTGDELVFDFNGDHGVANRLGSGAGHRIDGKVVGDGRLGFFADGSDLEINGSVTSDEVVVSGNRLADPAGFLSGGSYRLEAGSGFRQISINGLVRSTDGDVVVAGDLVRVRGEASLEASGAVRVGAGGTVDVSATGQERLEANGGFGILLHLGESRADVLELEASQEISNAGRLDAAGGFGKVFLEVGSSGKIQNEGTGVILGQATIRGDFDSDGVILGFDEGDALAVVNSSVIKLSALKDPDGRKVSRAREISTDAAMTGSADALRKPAKKPSRLVRGDKKPLLRRQSFFGMRGGGKRE